MIATPGNGVDGLLQEKADRTVASAAAHGVMIVTAESCTAGRLVTILTNAPRATSAVHGGYIVYTEAAKRALGVPAEVIERYGAVSSEVARLLADEALARSGAHVSVAITGVAGPERDDDDNPVGLVYIAVARRGSPGHVIRKRFGAMERSAIMHNTLDEALHLLREAIEFSPGQARE
jgi:nicotinamide-nucleotide amidase